MVNIKCSEFCIRNEDERSIKMNDKMCFAVLGMMIVMLLSVLPSATAQDSAWIQTRLLNQDPDPAEPGQYVELRWKVEKLGNEKLTGLTFKLEPQYPFYFDKIDTDTREVGDWAGLPGEDEYYTLYYKLRVDEDALEGDYDIRLNMKYGGSPSWVSKDYSVRVGEKEEAKFVLGTVRSSPVKLTSDLEEVELMIDIDNIGDGDAENVKVELSLPSGINPSYSYSNVKNLGTVEAGASETAIFYIDTDEDLTGGDYTANAKISYKDESDNDNEYKVMTLPLQINIKDQPRFEIISVEASPSNIHPGSEVSLKLTVKNIGGKEGESVSLRAFKESSQPFDFGEKSDFIGKLLPGETGEAVLKINVDNDANPKEYRIDVEIRSIYGPDVLIDEDQISIEVISATQKKEITFTPIVLVIVSLVIAVVAFFVGKKMKNDKK